MTLPGFLTLAATALMNVAATVMVRRDEYSELRQKILQIMLVWLPPVCGALVVLAVHRRHEKATGSCRDNGSGIGGDFGSHARFVKSISEALEDD